MHGTMRIVNKTGDTTVTWDPNNEASTRDARKQFDELRRQGYQAFLMETTHENGAVVEKKAAQRIETFPATAGKVMMVPQLRGG